MHSIMGAQLSARQTKHTETNNQTKKKTITSSALMEKAIEMLMDTDEDTHTDSTQVY